MNPFQSSYDSEILDFQYIFNLLQRYKGSIKFFDLRSSHSPPSLSLKFALHINQDPTQPLSINLQHLTRERELSRLRRYCIIIAYTSEYSSISKSLHDQLISLKCKEIHLIPDIEKFLTRYSFLCNDIFHSRDFPNEIIPGFLYLGTAEHAHSFEILEALKVTHILNATKSLASPFSGLRYLRVHIEDKETEKIAPWFLQSFMFIEEALQRHMSGESAVVLVHCAKGVSRSATLVIMYLMRSKNLKLQDAYDFIKKHRDVIEPNDGFMSELQEFERNNNEEFMAEAKRLQNEQQFLISECKRHIESNKLSLWGYKAELSTLVSQYKKLKLNLETKEKQYFFLQKEAGGYVREMRISEEVLGKANFEGLLETVSPYPIVLDISTAICIQIGTQSPSWRGFRKLLKESKTLIEALRSFNPTYISSEQMKYFSSLYKKHNLSLTIRDSKLPEEFLTFASWFLHSYLYTQKDSESKTLCTKIIQIEKEAARVYLEIKEINENILDCEIKLEKLLNCIEKAEKNINDLGSCNSQDFEFIKKSCEKIENTVKKSSIPDSLTGESNAPSILVESLFIQNTNSFNFEDLIEKSESKALISMEDMESSLPKELSHPITRIFPPKPRGSSKNKKRCCGFG